MSDVRPTGPVATGGAGSGWQRATDPGLGRPGGNCNNNNNNTSTSPSGPTRQRSPQRSPHEVGSSSSPPSYTPFRDFIYPGFLSSSSDAESSRAVHVGSGGGGSGGDENNSYTADIGRSCTVSPPSPSSQLPYLQSSPASASVSTSTSHTPSPRFTSHLPTSPSHHGRGPSPRATLPLNVISSPYASASGSGSSDLGLGSSLSPPPSGNRNKHRPSPLDLKGKGVDSSVSAAIQSSTLDGNLGVRSSHARMGSSESTTSTISNDLFDLSALRKSVQQNLRERPIESPLPWSDDDKTSSAGIGTSTSGRSSSPVFPSHSRPHSQTRSHSPAPVGSAEREITASDALALLSSSPQPLVVDVRPLDAFLNAHLTRSAHVSIPSLIFKRLRRQVGSRWVGGWAALGGFVSTPEGRAAWDAVDPNDHVDVVLLGAGGEDDIAPVLASMIVSLVPRGSVRVVRGGWNSVSEPAKGAGLIISGETGERTSPPALTSTLPPPRPAPTFDLTPPPIMVSPPANIVPNPMNHHPSIPTWSAPRRSLPSLSLNTGISPSGSTSTAPLRRPPKLSLTVDPSARSATLPSEAAPHTPHTGGRPKRALLTIDVGESSRRSIPSATRSAYPGSFQTLCHAQSKLPPSPRSFGDVDRDVRPDNSWTSGVTARPDTVVQSPGMYPNPGLPGMITGGYEAISTMSLSTPRHATPPFEVSTILPSFLFLGPEIASRADVDTLQRLGVRRILNVAIECDDDEGLGLREVFDRYYRIPMKDTVEESGVARGIRDSCEILDDARLHSAPIYVHCKAGKSRSVTVVLAYLIHANAWTLKTSYAYVAERRRGISPNIGFVAELMQYEEGELGLKQSGGVHGESSAGDNRDDDDQHGDGGGNSGTASKNGPYPRYLRESLPPAWASTHSLDSRPVKAAPLLGGVIDYHSGAPGAGSNTSGVDPTVVVTGVDDDNESQERSRRETGVEREVRKNGQWVHHRRAPVDRTTLQPGRRVSKAGLESMRGGEIGVGASARVSVSASASPRPLPGGTTGTTSSSSGSSFKNYGNEGGGGSGGGGGGKEERVTSSSEGRLGWV